MVQNLSARLTGSPDLYTQPDREPNRSINFCTSHDGFTLNDLVSYNHKHNLANLEDNRDGHNANYSWNCGLEGPTTVTGIKALRQKQARNFMTILFIAQGTPMILMGDECLRTQQGNNNAYCQDNQVGWFNWEHPDLYPGFLRFVRQLITFTQGLEVFRKEAFWHTSEGNSAPRLIWHGAELGQPDWAFNSHSLALELQSPHDGEHLHIILNAYWHPLTFELPAPGLDDDQDLHWHRIIDTSLAAPNDIHSPGEALAVTSNTYEVEARSSVVLLARRRAPH